jgi:hypothetical protein
VGSESFSVKSPFLDWMVYLPCTGKAPGLPSPAFTVDLPNQGFIAVVQKEPIQRGDAVDSARVETVRACLARTMPEVHIGT